MTTEKRCKDCLAEFAEGKLDKLPKRPAPHPGPRCASHNRIIRKERKALAHEKRVQSVYGLREREYEDLLQYQGGVCAVCRRANGRTRRLCVDHQHSSGCVRMIVCRPCNTMLGHGRDDPDFFRRAARLLESPPAVELLGYRGGSEMEYWKAVPGYDGWYEASTMGKVRSWKGVGSNATHKAPRRDRPLTLSQAEVRGGYLSIGLHHSGVTTPWRVNRLVLITFEGDEPELQACHRNGVRTDNRLSNLYWGTSEDNQADKERHGTQQRGESITVSILTEDDVMEIRRIWADPNCPIGAIQLGAKYGVSGPTAWKAATGKTWTHLPMPGDKR